MKKLILLSFILISSSLALTRTQAIHSPENCPENLRITAEPLKGQKDQLGFLIQFEADSLTKEKASAFLQVQHDDEILARVSLSPSIKGKTYTFTFQMARSAANDSKVTLSAYLCDDSGLAVIGGGRAFQINLGGFLPGQTKIVD